MAVVNILDKVTEWVKENVCSEIMLKVPPDNDYDATDEGYDYRLVTPSAFPLYVPAQDKTPPGVLSPIPSVCVRFLEGEERLTDREGSIGMQLCFCTWDPGLHGKDIFHPVNGNPAKIRRWSGEEADAYFKRSGEGWRDAWNFVDIALRELGNSLEIGGFELDRTVPIKYGPMTEQGEIVEAYPMWFAWASFSIKYPLRRNAEDIEQYL